MQVGKNQILRCFTLLAGDRSQSLFVELTTCCCMQFRICIFEHLSWFPANTYSGGDYSILQNKLLPMWKDCNFVWLFKKNFTFVTGIAAARFASSRRRYTITLFFFQEIDNWLGKNERTAIVPMFLPFLKKIILHISMVVPRACGGGFLPVFCAHVIVLCSSSVVVWPYFHTFLFKFITQTSSGRNHGGIPFLHVKVDQLEGKIL